MNSSQHETMKKVKKSARASPLMVHPIALDMVLGLRESVEKKYTDILMNKNRNIDNFILK
jgi:hypothetical protein